MYRLAGTAGIERAFDNVADGHQAADYTRVSSVAAPEFVPLLTCSMAHMLYKSSGAGNRIIWDVALRLAVHGPASPICL